MYKTSKTSMSAARLPAGKVRQDFAETVNRVAYGGERVVLHRRGRNLAALIPLEDLALSRNLRIARTRRKRARPWRMPRLRARSQFPGRKRRRNWTFSGDLHGYDPAFRARPVGRASPP